MLIKPVHITE